MFNIGDTVKFKTGKTEYQVSGTSEVTHTVDLAGSKVDKYGIAVDRLTLVRVADSASTDAKREALIEMAAPQPVLVAQDVSEHLGGETPAEYFERTGTKLDGRTTKYARVILFALQSKLIPIGQKTRFRRVKSTRGPKTSVVREG